MSSGAHRVSIETNTTIHSSTSGTGTDCGSDRYRNHQTLFHSHPADTAVTCTKCLRLAGVVVEVAKPVVVADKPAQCTGSRKPGRNAYRRGVKFYGACPDCAKVDAPLVSNHYMRAHAAV